MRYAYPCNLTPDEEDGGFNVSFPGVIGALTCGDDRAEALEMAEDALVVALCAYVDNNEDIPVPEAATEGQVMVAVPPIVAAKFALYTAMRKQGITAEELGNRLGLGEDAVRKVMDPGYGSHLTQVEKALRAVGRSLVVEDRAA
jgi:antitoxin HicB